MKIKRILNIEGLFLFMIKKNMVLNKAIHKETIFNDLRMILTCLFCYEQIVIKSKYVRI